MSQVIVLETQGKNDSVDYARVLVFDDVTGARNYCKDTNTGYKKYWKKAVIVLQGYLVDLYPADDEDKNSYIRFHKSLLPCCISGTISISHVLLKDTHKSLIQ